MGNVIGSQSRFKSKKQYLPDGELNEFLNSTSRGLMMVQKKIDILRQTDKEAKKRKYSTTEYVGVISSAATDVTAAISLLIHQFQGLEEKLISLVE